MDELKNKGILSDYIIENPEIAIQPGFVNFGEVTKGAEYRQEIDLLKLKELHRHVSFRVEAGTGVSVSDRNMENIPTSLIFRLNLTRYIINAFMSE